MLGHNLDIGAITRRAVRDAISDGKILDRAARDIRALLLGNMPDSADGGADDSYADTLSLWDEKLGFVKNAVLYSEADSDDGIPAGCPPDFEPEPGEGYGNILDE